MSKSLSRNALLRSAIFDYVLRSGAAGYTDEEIADYIGVAARRVRSARRQLVQQRDLTGFYWRRHTASGRSAMVWLTTRVARKLLNNRSLDA